MAQRTVLVVHFVRDVGLWIVSDRLHGEFDHEYEQYWYLNYDKSEVDLDEVGRSLRADHPDAADLDLYQFSSKQLDYDLSDSGLRSLLGRFGAGDFALFSICGSRWAWKWFLYSPQRPFAGVSQRSGLARAGAVRVS